MERRLRGTLKRVDEVIGWGRGCVGKNQYLKYLMGERITRQEAIKAKCYECNGYCVDGRPECKAKDCPLWAYSPFRKE